MAIISVADYQAITDDTTTKTARLEILIPIVEADYLRIRRKPFDLDAAGAIVYPDGAKLTAARMLAFLVSANGVTPAAGGGGLVNSESLGDHSISYNAAALAGASDTGYPSTIVANIDRYITTISEGATA